MTEFHKIWIEQCEGVHGIKENFGVQKALGYLIGEKLLNFIRTSDNDPLFAKELPKFVSEIKSIFQPLEIREYLENVRRVGVLGHVMSDDSFESFRAAGAVDEDVVRSAEEVLIMERIKELLLD